MDSVYKEKNYTDILHTHWEKNNETGENTRVFSCTANLTSKGLGPTMSYVTEIQTQSSLCRENELYVVNCAITNSGVPYADNFRIYTHICITKELPENGGSNNEVHSRFTYFYLLKFKKTPFFFVRTLVEKNSYEGIQGMADDIVAALLTEAARRNGTQIVQREKTKKDTSSDASTNLLFYKCKEEMPPSEVISPMKTCTVVFTLLLLVSIAVMNSYLYFKLHRIEIGTNKRLPLIGEKIMPGVLEKPPSIQAIESALNELKIHEEIIKKHFERWKERLDKTFQCIKKAEYEVEAIMKTLPDYEHELLQLLPLNTRVAGAAINESDNTSPIHEIKEHRKIDKNIHEEALPK